MRLFFSLLAYVWGYFFPKSGFSPQRNPESRCTPSVLVQKRCVLRHFCMLSVEKGKISRKNGGVTVDSPIFASVWEYFLLGIRSPSTCGACFWCSGGPRGLESSKLSSEIGLRKPPESPWGLESSKLSSEIGFRSLPQAGILDTVLKSGLPVASRGLLRPSAGN